MVDCVESLADVDADGCGAQRRFSLVETVGDAGDSRKKGGYAGMGRAKTMLGGGRSKGRGDEREDKTFKDLRDRTKEGNWAVRLGVKGRFFRFRDRED